MIDTNSGNNDDRGPSVISIRATRSYRETMELLAQYKTDDARRNKLIVDALLDAAITKHERIVGLFIYGRKK